MASVPTHHNPSNTILLIDQALRNKKQYNCVKYRRIVPNIEPSIYSLSSYSAKFNTYIQIYVYGENFLPNGISSVDFGSIKNIPISYINHGSFYFEVPFVSFPGVYNVVVKNNINLIGRSVTANSSGRLSLESNIVEFTITSA
jgi:hypothetical protein